MPETIYPLNTKRASLHKMVDGRSYESCNLDDLTFRRDLTLTEAQEIVGQGKAKLCRRCFPDGALETAPGSPDVPGALV